MCAVFAVAPQAAACGGGTGGGSGGGGGGAHAHAKAHDLEGALANLSVTIGTTSYAGTLRFSAAALTLQGPLAAPGLVGGKLSAAKKSNGFSATATYGDGGVITWSGTVDRKAKTAVGIITLKRKDGTSDTLNFGAFA